MQKITIKLILYISKGKGLVEFFINLADKRGGNLDGTSIEDLKIVLQKLKECEDILNG